LLPGFDAALDGLTANILLMGALVRRNLCNANTGFLRRDDDDCSAVIADDEEVDLLEKTVDKEGTAILLRFQPMTFDLRRVLATIKLGNSPRKAFRSDGGDSPSSTEIARRTTSDGGGRVGASF
jgi:phosphate transport system protein